MRLPEGSVTSEPGKVAFGPVMVLWYFSWELVRTEKDQRKKKNRKNKLNTKLILNVVVTLVGDRAEFPSVSIIGLSCFNQNLFTSTKYADQYQGCIVSGETKSNQCLG